jgi:hypothetical protein
MTTYHISENFRELTDRLNVDRYDHIALSRLATTGIVHRFARDSGCAAGLIYQCEGLGRHLIVERPGDPVMRDEIKRHAMYALAPVGHELEVAEHLARAIAAKHGPGHWWDTGGCVGYCGDDGQVRGGEIGGVPYVVLRAYYFHDPVKVNGLEEQARQIASGRVDPAKAVRNMVGAVVSAAAICAVNLEVDDD